MKLIIFSDLHYCSKPPIHDPLAMHRKLYHTALPMLANFINLINSENNYGGAIFLGDLIEDLNNHDDDIVNYTYVWNKLKAIKIPFYACIGNHELRTMNHRSEIESIMGYNSSTYSINLNGYHLVFLTPTIDNKASFEAGGIYRTKMINSNEIEWLNNDLKNNNLPCLIFTHYGLAEDTMKGNWWFSKNSEAALLGNRKEVKEILKANKNVIAVFSGHQHWTKKIKEDGLNYYILGSMAENINDDGIPDGVYYEVNIEEKKCEVLEKHLKL